MRDCYFCGDEDTVARVELAGGTAFQPPLRADLCDRHYRQFVAGRLRRRPEFSCSLAFLSIIVFLIMLAALVMVVRSGFLMLLEPPP